MIDTMMRYFKLFGLLLCMLGLPFCKKGNGQAPNVRVEDDDFNTKLQSLLSFTVPVITVDSLHSTYDQYIILDAREKNEYDVSHLNGALSIGHTNFDIQSVKHIDKDRPIVVYCSVGYRSEIIGEKLVKAGFSNVQNLYGSIFEWVNQGLPVVDINGQKTTRIHTYNRRWSRWVREDENIKKVY